MATALYDLTVPVFTHHLGILAKLLEKGRAFAEEKGIDPGELLQARLIEDMHPLIYQVQRVSDTAKNTPIRLGELDPLPLEDSEASFDDLQARIARTLAFLATVPRERIDGREGAEVVLNTPNRSVTFTGRDYVLQFALPNFYFHVTTAYAILRSRGVPVGKLDYLGGN